ncbi:hypothetical protein ACFS7Z_14315 [Pontibacter toksunensis]|uniref:Stress protein DDR48 n=1 Tax=Pontibacter toksunensis TaxID=1332631 RepID=A0ABW6BWB0_9BACT
MNRNQNERHDNSGGYQTHRSEKYRHPERDSNTGSNYRFDDYGSSARGGYGNESHSGTWGNQGNEMAGSRNVSNRGISNDTYSTSRNYGNMGSYGGAQGFGTARGGTIAQRHYGSESTNYNFESGMGNPGEARGSSYSPGGHRVYSYERDYDSHGSDMGNRSYGSSRSGTSRGSQDYNSGNYGSGQNDYNSYGGGSSYSSGHSNQNKPGRSSNYSSDQDRDRDSDNDRNRGFLGNERRDSRSSDRSSGSFSGSRDLYGSDTSRRFEGTSQGRYDFDQDDYNYGSGSYRDSSNRSSYGDNSKRGSFGSDKYNSANFGGDEGSYMGSGYNRDSQDEYGSGRSYSSYGYGSIGGYSNDQPQPYDLTNRNSGRGSSDSNYIKSSNRGRTVDRDRGDDRDRSIGGRY